MDLLEYPVEDTPSQLVDLLVDMPEYLAQDQAADKPESPVDLLADTREHLVEDTPSQPVDLPVGMPEQAAQHNSE